MIKLALGRSHKASAHEKWSRGFVVHSTPRDQEIAKIYRQLEMANEQNGVPKLLEPEPRYEYASGKRVVGVKRSRLALEFDPLSPFSSFQDLPRHPMEHPPERRMVKKAWYTCHCVLGYHLKRNFG